MHHVSLATLCAYVCNFYCCFNVSYASLQKLPYALYEYFSDICICGIINIGILASGVEFSWWDGPETCSTGSQNYNFDINNPLKGLDGMIRPPACSEAMWHFLGLSMAAWNTLISLTGVLLAILATRWDLKK